MLPFRRILFPVDFSDRCRGAAEYVEFFTGRFDAQLFLLHVTEPFRAETRDTAAHSDSLERMRRFLSSDFQQLSVEYHVGEGDPGVVIVDFARNHDIDLIMMPTHEYGPFRRFLLGSVTAKVLHDAPCPVWTGAHVEQAPPVTEVHCRELVCGVEPRQRDVAVIEAASKLAREFNGRLAVTCAIPMPVVQTEVTISSAGTEYIAAALAGTRNEITDMLAEAHAKGCVCVGMGSPGHVLSEVARQRKADLLVIGRSQGEGVLGRLRADAYSIIRDAPCPVLSV